MDRNAPPILGCHAVGGQARKSLWIETPIKSRMYFDELGQARKSLWIETKFRGWREINGFGQARKSLWIETTVSGHSCKKKTWSGS